MILVLIFSDYCKKLPVKSGHFSFDVLGLPLTKPYNPLGSLGDGFVMSHHGNSQLAFAVQLAK